MSQEFALTLRIAEIKRLIVFVMGVRNLTATRMTTMRTAWPARRMVVSMVNAGILLMIAIRILSSDMAIYILQVVMPRPMRIASWGPRSRKSDPRPDMLTRRLKHAIRDAVRVDRSDPARSA